MLLLVSGRPEHGMIRIWQPDTGVAKATSTGHAQAQQAGCIIDFSGQVNA
jgi:hypothetical protein